MTSENSEVKSKPLEEILKSYLGGYLWLEEILPSGGLSIRPMQESDLKKSEIQKKIMNKEFVVFPLHAVMLEETSLLMQREKMEENNGEPNELDVELVMSHVPNVSEGEVKKTLRETKNDVVDAIMKLTKLEE